MFDCKGHLIYVLFTMCYELYLLKIVFYQCLYILGLPNTRIVHISDVMLPQFVPLILF